MLFHKIIRRFVYTYIRNEEKILNGQLKQGVNSNICYPCILGHEELINIGENTKILGYGRLQLYPEHADVTIGNNVLMASDVTIVSHNHGFDLNDENYFMNQPLTIAL